MTALMTEIITLLVAGIQDIAKGIGEGLQSLVSNLFMTSEGALSAFGGVTVIFAGIALAIGLCTLVFHWLTGFGKN